jgi:SAM-dependent methyltransferase
MHPSSYQGAQKFFSEHVGPALAARPSAEPYLVLDVGSMDVNGSYKPIFSHPGICYVGLDMAAGNNVDIVTHDPYRYPLEDGVADCVISGQALEHSEFFWEAFREMVRVLRPGGLLCLIVPSTGPIHRYPVDCYRFYPDSLAALAKWAGASLVSGWMHESPPWNDLVGVFSKH